MMPVSQLVRDILLLVAYMYLVIGIITKFIERNYCRQVWDRSHFLENLSGFETSCAMIIRDDWDFAHATEVAGERGMRISGVYGSARNRASTPRALREILHHMKKVRLWARSQNV